MSSPWADPSTPTEPGTPYAAPPPAGTPHAHTAPPSGWPPSGWPPSGWPPSGYPAPWGPVPPPGPRRPGQVVAAAVLTFVQAALVLLSSAYVFLLASVAGIAAAESITVPGRVADLATEARVVAVVQLVSAIALVVAGLLALNRRRRSSRAALLAALGVQVALAAYWAIRLSTVLDDVAGPDPGTAFVTMSLFFAASPLVALGLVLAGPGRRWFAERGPGAR